MTLKNVIFDGEHLIHNTAPISTCLGKAENCCTGTDCDIADSSITVDNNSY